MTNGMDNITKVLMVLMIWIAAPISIIIINRLHDQYIFETEHIQSFHNPAIHLAIGFLIVIVVYLSTTYPIVVATLIGLIGVSVGIYIVGVVIDIAIITPVRNYFRES